MTERWPYADQRPDLPPLEGLREIPGGRGPSLAGQQLWADPAIQAASQRLLDRLPKDALPDPPPKRRRTKKGTADDKETAVLEDRACADVAHASPVVD